MKFNFQTVLEMAVAVALGMLIYNALLTKVATKIDSVMPNFFEE